MQLIILKHTEVPPLIFWRRVNSDECLFQILTPARIILPQLKIYSRLEVYTCGLQI